MAPGSKETGKGREEEGMGRQEEERGEGREWEALAPSPPSKPSPRTDLGPGYTQLLSPDTVGIYCGAVSPLSHGVLLPKLPA